MVAPSADDASSPPSARSTGGTNGHHTTGDGGTASCCTHPKDSDGDGISDEDEGASEKPPRVVIGYKIQERATNKEVYFTKTLNADEFLQKGNPVVPIGMVVKVKDLDPGAYRLVLMAAEEAARQAPPRSVDFDLTD